MRCLEKNQKATNRIGTIVLYSRIALSSTLNFYSSDIFGLPILELLVLAAFGTNQILLCFLFVICVY